MQTKAMPFGPFSGLHQVYQKKVVWHIKLKGMKIRLKLASNSDVLLLLRRTIGMRQQAKNQFFFPPEFRI